ncbi:LysR family transcriptional regulator [Paenibacillus sp. V4I3]|uniref:LysR family transcriptional regulator n=1 Tax=Paenibacillus sp. V4I3 TaxID=3042305 RepID=UPI0027D90BF3|nr:LysR family transcriptional regulator [Paenibacillus sp. V4I3]
MLAIELKNLKSFQVAADYMNLTKAAEHLGYTQPTITLQIQLLEKEIGHKLFHRIGKQTFLTPAGNLLKQYTDKLMLVVQEMEEGLKQLDLPHGSLVIAAPEFYCSHYLSFIISDFLKAYPQINLRLVSCNSHDTIKMISSRTADIGIIAGACDSKEIEAILLKKEDLLLTAASNLTPENDLSFIFKNFPFISYQHSCNFTELVNSCLSNMTYSPSSIIELGSEETIKQAVINKMGIALVSEDLMKSEINTGAVTVLERFPNQVETSVIYLKSRAHEPAIKSFSDLLQGVWDIQS